MNAYERQCAGAEPSYAGMRGGLCRYGRQRGLNTNDDACRHERERIDMTPVRAGDAPQR